MARPENFELAMCFLGGKDADDVRRYVEEIEKLLREVYENGETSTLHRRIGAALGLSD